MKDSFLFITGLKRGRFKNNEISKGGGIVKLLLVLDHYGAI